MVGDTPFDRDAARGASMWFVGLRMEGDVRVESLPEVLQLAGV
jgi:hypothetical protein